MYQVKPISFAAVQKDFFSVLNQRIQQHFKQSGTSRYANTEMVVKTMFMFALYTVPYALIVAGVPSSFGGLLLLYAIMGIGLAGIGLSVMHDANHGAYSRKQWVNQALGYSLNVIGGHALTWKIQHNVLHHTFTNIHEADEDISPRGVLRLAPGSPWKPAHRYQHFYAWGLYCLLTLVWVFVKDFSRLRKYQAEGLLRTQHTTATREWTVLLLTKAVYLLCIIVLPALVLPFPVWQILVCFLAMHAIAGFILSIVFQPAHVADGTAYPEPDTDGKLQNSWAVHQLHTTTNFAPGRKLFSWFVGGLNYQIEHHLFPGICHVHYRRIAPIVAGTAREFNLPYRSLPSFRKALVLHTQLLKKLGSGPGGY
jgi:linoleoyl-CoA desaturase